MTATAALLTTKSTIIARGSFPIQEDYKMTDQANRYEAPAKQRRQANLATRHQRVAALDATPHSGDAAPRLSQWEIFSTGWQVGCANAARAARVSADAAIKVPPPASTSWEIFCAGIRAGFAAWEREHSRREHERAFWQSQVDLLTSVR